jgi:hypothetical protein
MSDRTKISGVSNPEVEQDLQFVSLIQLQSRLFGGGAF